MSILTALVSHLLQDAGVSDLVADRIYADRIPPSTSEAPNAMPLLTYTLLDDPASTTHDKKDVFAARIQVDAWGGSYESAHAAADAVHRSLHGYKGAMGEEGIDVGGCFRKSKRDNNYDAVELFRVEQIYLVNYKE